MSQRLIDGGSNLNTQRVGSVFLGRGKAHFHDLINRVLLPLAVGPVGQWVVSGIVNRKRIAEARPFGECPQVGR